MAKKTTTTTKDENKVSVLAYEKKLPPSDGFFYGTTWDLRHTTASPLHLFEKAIRGVISNRLIKNMEVDDAKLDADAAKANIQRVDNCALGEHQDTLKVQFTLKVLSGVEKPSACNNSNFRKTYAAAVKKYIDTHGFTELARRYAINIANGRFLWRNRVGADKIEVVVIDDQGTEWRFDASQISTRNFNATDAGIQMLAGKIADALSGKIPYLVLDVTAYALVGRAQDVYPSQELVMDKSKEKGKKNKILYSIDGVAGMHSQKIGNAIRTIDTWYPDYDDPEVGVGPIAVEPFGSVTNLGKAYRTCRSKKDFYTLFDNWARGGTLPCTEDEHYVMGVLIRGGVFGEAEKDKE